MIEPADEKSGPVDFLDNIMLIAIKAITQNAIFIFNLDIDFFDTAIGKSRPHEMHEMRSVLFTELQYTQEIVGRLSPHFEQFSALSKFG